MGQHQNCSTQDLNADSAAAVADVADAVDVAEVVAIDVIDETIGEAAH